MIENETTRPSATAALLDHLENSRYESETCEILNVMMLTSDEALPPHSVVTCRIKHPSILADCLLERTYGPEKAIGGWTQTYSDQAPDDFEPSAYFEEHKTAHVPPVYRNHLAELERQSGFPFAKQWEFEWKIISSFSEISCSLKSEIVGGKGTICAVWLAPSIKIRFPAKSILSIAKTLPFSVQR